MKKSKTTTLFFALGAMLITIMFSGCADVTPITECIVDEPCGFWFGLWHGIIVVISFIGSLFMDDVAIYAVNNNGGWYDFGFMLGAGLLSSAGSRATR